MNFHRISLLMLAAAFTFSVTSCLTQRTVSQGGRTVKQSYVIKNPVKQ